MKKIKVEITEQMGSGFFMLNVTRIRANESFILRGKETSQIWKIYNTLEECLKEKDEIISDLKKTKLYTISETPIEFVTIKELKDGIESEKETIKEFLANGKIKINEIDNEVLKAYKSKIDNNDDKKSLMKKYDVLIDFTKEIRYSDRKIV